MDRFFMVAAGFILISVVLTTIVHYLFRRRPMAKYLLPLLAFLIGSYNFYMIRVGPRETFVDIGRALLFVLCGFFFLAGGITAIILDIRARKKMNKKD